MRFFWDVVLPLSKTSMAALFVIQFIYGWNQYLWPLLITTDESMYTTVIGIKRMIDRRRRATSGTCARHRDARPAAARAGGRADAALVRQRPGGDRKVNGRALVPRREESYAGLQVIHGVSMEVKDGEFVVIVGPSGCGKSTLLRMVAGLEPISAGEIASARVVNDLEPKDRDIAMVFQNYALYPHMSVYDNMSYGLRIKGFAKQEIETRAEGGRDPRAEAFLEGRASSPADSASAWRWGARSCASRRCSCSTSRFPTWTPSCACRCAPSCRRCIGASARRACT